MPLHAFLESLRCALAHPLTRGLALDDPRTTERRRQVILAKPALRAIYGDWYRLLVRRLPAGPGALLEIGSGAGFLRRLVPAALTSEIMAISGIDVVCDARRLPFASGSLRAIAMVDVLHHLPDVDRFFAGARSCLRPGGRLVMIEPWKTPLSSLVYRHLHHEAFAPAAPEWRFPSSGPLSSANGALPWMIFARDRALFQRRHPDLQLREVTPVMPLRYLFSAGVARRIGAPGWFDAALRSLEGDSALLRRLAAMFAVIVVERR
jgi:SAM-dependent methyltransferase